MRPALLLLSACGRIGFGDDNTPPPPVDAASVIAAEFELESGDIVPPFLPEADPNASGGFVVKDDNGIGLSGPGSVTLTFTLAEANAYFVWARTVAPDTATDSFFLEFDSTGTVPFDTSQCDHGASFHWVQLRTFTINCPGLGAPLALDLAAGSHQLVVTSREGGSFIDRMLLTADATFVPTD